jgi:uroporphyrin-III C-methyltransferase
VSESFWVITGTTRTGQLSNDVALAAQSTATVVILMGMNKLSEIQSVFVQQGKSTTPVAIIQHGSLPQEQVAISQVRDLVATAAKQQLGAPAIIIIGEVVNERIGWELPQELLNTTQYAHA